jgi:putative oxidoreductase
MRLLDTLLTPNRWLAQGLNLLQPAFALATRLYVSWQFLNSGWLKLRSWDQTLFLFESEYHVPLLPPHVAAVAGTCGELFFPALLVAGFSSRLAAVGLFAVNALAVISYSQVLLAEGAEAALGQHVLWGFMAAYLAIHGPGRWSLDAWLGKSMSMRHSTPAYA